MRIRLWFIRESDSGQARLYSKIPSSRNPTKDDEVWLPLSQVERTTKFPPKEGEKWPEHHMVVADWLAKSKGL